MHPEKADKERPFFQALKDKHAKCGQPFTIGEKLVLPAIKEVISTVMERDPTHVLKSLPLSNDTVARRINEMGADTEEQLCVILQDSYFSIQLDETTTSDNNALLMSTIGPPTVSEALTDDRLLIYIDHLRMVKADMEIRFKDLLDLDVPIWVVQPFQADVVNKCEPAIQEHLIDIQCDDEAQATFLTSDWGSMWVKYAELYPALWEKIKLLLLSFPTTYLVEQGFSQVLHMQSKYRNRLDLMDSGALRLKLTSLQSAVKKLTEKHQVQGSH
ncbi:SCAN domain-containing protein 3-like isoform X2 [Cottoperca gobio]|uniref:SCAN domain-containing protein 3-like isoform X2 n=1 Tax=Cottoperca gobio TaxID=56716 RepID=A0A6J2P6G6_COTGO|nr:SCAN domain-containing protein 3-like isoform X2 [Cottoperca gobio]